MPRRQRMRGNVGGRICHGHDHVPAGTEHAGLGTALGVLLWVGGGLGALAQALRVGVGGPEHGLDRLHAHLWGWKAGVAQAEHVNI